MSSMTEWMIDLPWWGFLLVLVAVLGAMTELGFRLARRTLRRDDGKSSAERRASHVSVLLGAIFGLLALLLAFSFGIVESRYAARKTLVIEEANAIGTAFLRAKLLPEPQSSNVQRLLREYLELRFVQAGTDDTLQATIARSEKIHGMLWRELKPLADAAPHSQIVGRFMSALNDMIDLHTTRLSVSAHQRLPIAIFDILILVSTFAMLMLGYGAGLGAWRAPIPALAFIWSIAAVVVMIQQLDTPRTRMFHVSQWALEDVRKTVDK